MKITKEKKEELREELLESIAIQESHYYEDEDDFEEKYGPSDNLEEVASMYIERKCHEDVVKTCKVWIKAFPESRDFLLNLFGLTNIDLKEE